MRCFKLCSLFNLTLFLLPFWAGCSFLPVESHKIPHPSSRELPSVAIPFREAQGVVHVHSTYSDGTGTIEEIAQVAQKQDLDFVILTDHNTLAAKKEGKAGPYGRTLVLADAELSTPSGHYVALRLQEIPPADQTQKVIDQVAASGGLGFIAHPSWRKAGWKLPDAQGFHGLEIYNAAENAYMANPAAVAFWTVMAGSDFSLLRWLRRPKESLALWDRYLQQGSRLVGIGGADAHGLKRFGMMLGPYSGMFRMVRNHLLYEGELSEAAVYGALERGRVFVSHPVVADAAGFRFAAVVGGKSLAVMGEQVQRQKDLKLYAYLPSPGTIRLFRDGKIMGEAFGQTGWFRPLGPGIYRVEASRKGRPWIYSNPIYVIE